MRAPNGDCVATLSTYASIAFQNVVGIILWYLLEAQTRSDLTDVRFFH